MNYSVVASFESLFKFFVFCSVLQCSYTLARYKFEVREENYTRLCTTKNILTVNGRFPGPTLHAHTGDTIIVDVINRGNLNITIHWHGVTMTRNPWHDGPQYITQCPIPPGGSFRQKVIFGEEEDTLWWHAHSNWTRATVHGAIVIYPRNGKKYPFPKPYAEVPIILGEWWNIDIQTLYYAYLRSGGGPNVSDALLINGQPGNMYPCSQQDMFRLKVDKGKTYLLRIINAVLQQIIFFGIANHKLTVVGSDGSYTKPFTTDYLAISPGQTIDVLLEANQPPNDYYMAAKLFERTPTVAIDNTTTTGIIQYNYGNNNYTRSFTPSLPILPIHNYIDSDSSINFFAKLKSLANKDYPIDVPLDITTRLFYTLNVNALTCPREIKCDGRFNTRLAASMNNITFVDPTIDLLEAYYYKVNGQFEADFPDKPPLVFNYTADVLPDEFVLSQDGTKVKVLEYNATIEVVFQGTTIVAGAYNPMHLHGHSFYVVGSGEGNFNPNKDPLGYNLVDPPFQNIIAVPFNGWTAIRFRAHNPGVWFLHCHLDRHATWGMDMAFIVKNGKTPESRMLPPPRDMPKCLKT